MNIIDTFRKQQRPSTYKIIFDYVDSLPEEKREFFWKLIIRTTLWDVSWLDRFIKRMPSLDYLHFIWDLQPLISLRRIRMRFNALLYEKKIRYGDGVDSVIFSHKRKFLELFWNEIMEWLREIGREKRESDFPQIIDHLWVKCMKKLPQMDTDSWWSLSDIDTDLLSELDKFHTAFEEALLREMLEDKDEEDTLT